MNQRTFTLMGYRYFVSQPSLCTCIKKIDLKPPNFES